MVDGILHSVNQSHLLTGGLRFLKNHIRWDQDFLVKMGGIHIGGLSIEEG